MSSVPDLRVHLRGPEQEQFRGRCTDLDSSQDDVVSTVEFSSGHAPVIRLGETAQLSFRGGGLVSNIESEALTILRADEPTRRSYSFRLNQIPKELLLVLANRRHCPRIRPSESRPVRVQMLDRTGSVYYKTVAHDISATGLSIIVDPNLEARLYTVLQVRLAILLPQAKELLEMFATIRSRRFFGPAIHYGLRFEEQGARFAHAREQISIFLESSATAGGPRP